MGHCAAAQGCAAEEMNSVNRRFYSHINSSPQRDSKHKSASHFATHCVH